MDGGRDGAGSALLTNKPALFGKLGAEMDLVVLCAAF